MIPLHDDDDEDGLRVIRAQVMLTTNFTSNFTPSFTPSSSTPDLLHPELHD